MTVSVLISTYNWPSALKLSVESLFNQTILPNEILIADDGSGKETEDVVAGLIKNAPRGVYIKHIWQEDKGFRLAAIRNKALSQAKSDYIIQIDGDCIAEPHFVEDHLSMARKGRLITGSRVFVDKATTKIACDKGLFDKREIKTTIDRRISAIRYSLLKYAISPIYKRNNIESLRGCNMSYFLEDAIRVNGYNEDFEGWGHEDLEFNFRLYNSGVRKMNMKFGAILYHLYHPERSKDNENDNKKVAYNVLNEHITRIDKGIDQYMSKKI